MFLTRFASKVTLMHRRDSFRASKIMQDRVFANKKIEIKWNTGIKEIVGTKEEGVTGVKIYDTETKKESDFPTQGVFIAIGHKPNTELFKDWLEMDETGYLKTEGRTMKTNIEGVLPAATRRTLITGRQSPPPVQAVWRRLMPNDF